MGLLQNVSVLNAEPIRYVPGGAAAQCANRFSFTRPETRNNQMIGEGSFDDKSGVPNGYAPPYAIVMPIKDGGMSCYRNIFGDGEIATSNLRQVKAMVSRTTPKMGSGTISSAPLSMLVWFTLMGGTLTGEGEITTSDLKNILNMGLTITGAGEVSDTTLLAILAWMNANITANGTLDGSVMKGWADMAARISSEGDLVTAASCARAVWDELLASHQNTGSTGKALNDAGAAGNPWSADASSNNDPDTMGEKLNKIKNDTGLIPATL